MTLEDLTFCQYFCIHALDLEDLYYANRATNTINFNLNLYHPIRNNKNTFKLLSLT